MATTPLRPVYLLAVAVALACSGDDSQTADGSTSTAATDASSSSGLGSTGGSTVADTTADGETADPETDGTTDETGAAPSSIGGTLEGLQGASVEISNGGDLLVLDADGAFTFGESVVAGESYAVEVTVQPAGPDQTCTVSNGRGVAAGRDITEIGVRCVTPIRQVVVVGLDGLGGQWVDEATTPVLDALRDQGVWTLEMQNALPTSSSTNWTSMLDGVSPQQHGVLSNGWQPGDSNPPPTMFAALRGAEPDARIGVFHDWTDFGRLVEPGVADFIGDPGDEQETMDAATAWLQEESPRLLFIHLDHIDHAGHASTWESAAYLDAVSEGDALVGQLRTALEDAGMWPYTALIVSADHGGQGFSHGGDTRAERATPFIMHTPQGGTGIIERQVRIWDIAATVLALLDVPAPESWLASPIVEGLYASPFSLPPAPASATGRSFDSPVWLYDETGTGANTEVSLWRPVISEGYALLGDMVVQGHDAPTASAFGLLDERGVVEPPAGFELIWQDTLSGGFNDVSIWNPIAPLGYVCMGSVAVAGYVEPQVDHLRCVHASLVQPGLSALTWDDAGSGAAWDATLWSCIPGGAEDPAAAGLGVGSFITRRHASDPGINRCMTLRPEAVTVEE